MVKLNFITAQEHGLHSMQEHTHSAQSLLSGVNSAALCKV